MLGHPRLLDSNFRLNDLGAAIAEPGAGAQLFHVDDDYILGRESMAINGVGGHDLPSTAITVLHPLWAVTKRHSRCLRGASVERTCS